jgi:uncharacterized protein YbdZ (MbtH family)
MNKNEKIKFINDLLDSVKQSILKNVDNMPEGWNGEEIRQYIVDYIITNANWIRMTPKKFNKYRCDLVTNDLL